MEILQIIITSLFATSAMTAFSYLASESFQELWKEPVLLNIVTAKADVNLSPKAKSLFGWLVHYLFGLSFVIAYHILWSSQAADPTWFCGLIFGILSGILGIIGWFFLFKIAGVKPKIKVQQYYLQLFFAHIIFGLASVGVYKIFGS